MFKAISSVLKLFPGMPTELEENIVGIRNIKSLSKNRPSTFRIIINRLLGVILRMVCINIRFYNNNLPQIPLLGGKDVFY